MVLYVVNVFMRKYAHACQREFCCKLNNNQNQSIQYMSTVNFFHIDHLILHP